MLAINLMREHSQSIYEGTANDGNYVTTVLFVTGKPDVGKSTLVTALDEMSDIMQVGKLLKTAFLGISAVAIGGSSLCSSLDVPI